MHISLSRKDRNITIESRKGFNASTLEQLHQDYLSQLRSGFVRHIQVGLDHEALTWSDLARLARKIEIEVVNIRGETSAWPTADISLANVPHMS